MNAEILTDTVTGMAPQLFAGTTSFLKLSSQAQEYIVRTMLGEYKDNPPDDMPDSVGEEIAEWAISEDEIIKERKLDEFKT